MSWAEVKKFLNKNKTMSLDEIMSERWEFEDSSSTGRNAVASYSATPFTVSQAKTDPSKFFVAGVYYPKKDGLVRVEIESTIVKKNLQSSKQYMNMYHYFNVYNALQITSNTSASVSETLAPAFSSPDGTVFTTFPDFITSNSSYLVACYFTEYASIEAASNNTATSTKSYSCYVFVKRNYPVLVMGKLNSDGTHSSTQTINRCEFFE